MNYKEFLQVAEKYSKNRLVSRENITPEDIETCNGVSQEDETTNTCLLCVAVNNTVYRAHNKCEYTHQHCKCKYNGDAMKRAKTIFPLKKMSYAFTDEDKSRALRSMGYLTEDCEELHNTLNLIAKTQYELGRYILNTLNINGPHIQIDTVITSKETIWGKFFSVI